MKSKSKVIVFFFIFAILMICLSVSVFSQSYQYENLEYVTEDNSVVITGCNNAYSGAIVIPDSIDNIPVKRIAADAFSECGFSEITLPLNLAYADAGAFYHCDNLRRVNIYSKYLSVSGNGSLFSDCDRLEEINFCDGVISIESGICSNLYSLKTATLSESVERIGKDAFFSSGIQSVHISAGVKYISDTAFCNCMSLCEFSVDDNNTMFSSDNGILYSKDMKTVIRVPEMVSDCNLPLSVKEISSYAFAYCNIQSFDFGSQFEKVGNCAFLNCYNLGFVTIDCDCTFGTNVFDGCLTLTSVEFAKGATVVSDRLFKNCTSLSNVVMSNIESIGDYSFYGCTDLGYLIFSDSLKSIGEYAFDSCSALADIYLPNSLVSIGQGGFEKCTSLQYVLLSDSLSDIPNGCFYGCTQLSDVTLPSALRRIGQYAFSECNAIDKIKIPADVISIGAYAFYNDSLSWISLNDALLVIGYKAINCSDTTIYCNCDTVGASYAISNNLPYEYLDSHTHIFGDWEVVKEPSFDESGSEKRICEVCDFEDVKILPRLMPDIVMDVDNYTVSLNESSGLQRVRFAKGTYDQNTFKNAPDIVTLNEKIINSHITDGVFKYELNDGGIYTFELRYNAGVYGDDLTKFMVVVDMTNMKPSIDLQGLNLTVNNLYGVSDFFIAYGNGNTKTYCQNNLVVLVSSAKINGAKSYKYTLPYVENGEFTIFLRYAANVRTDGVTSLYINNESASIGLTPGFMEHIDRPTFSTYGLTMTVSDMVGVKIIRTAPGTWNTNSEIKSAPGYIGYSASGIQKQDPTGATFKIKYSEKKTGDWTAIVLYENGYYEIYHYTISKIIPVITTTDDSIIISEIDGIDIIRWAPGNTSKPKEVPGNKYVKGKDIDTTKPYVIENLHGQWSFLIQYLDGSQTGLVHNFK